MQNWLNYHHLLYFKTIAEEGSLAKASEVLRVGQSALSMQLKLLEDRLERPLFERRQKKLVLTEAGQLALDYARQIFSLGTEMLDTLADGRDADHTRVQIGVEEGVPHYAATALVGQALRIPGTRPVLSHGSGEALVGELLEHRLDLVLALEQSHARDRSILFQKRVLHAPLFALAAPKFAALKKEFPGSLSGAPLLVQSPLSRPRHELERFFHEQGLELSVAVESDENVLLRNLAVEGHGVSFFSEGSVAESVKKKQLVILGKLPIFLDLWLVGLKRKVDNPVGKQLLREFTLEN